MCARDGVADGWITEPRRNHDHNGGWMTSGEERQHIRHTATSRYMPVHHRERRIDLTEGRNGGVRPSSDTDDEAFRLDSTLDDPVAATVFDDQGPYSHRSPAPAIGCQSAAPLGWAGATRSLKNPGLHDPSLLKTAARRQPYTGEARQEVGQAPHRAQALRSVHGKLAAPRRCLADPGGKAPWRAQHGDGTTASGSAHSTVRPISKITRSSRPPMRRESKL